MQHQSNLPFIQYIASADDSEQQYGELKISSSQEDFMLSLSVVGMQLNFSSLNANETAVAFATRHTPSLFVREADTTKWITTVNYKPSNGFYGVHEIMHVLEIESERLLEVKAALIHNKYAKCKFTLFPKKDFFETVHLYKLGQHGASYASEIDHFIEYEY